MNAHPRTRFRTRARPALALLLGAVVAAGCEDDDAVTSPEAPPGPRAVITDGSSFEITGATTEAEHGLTAAGAEAVRVELAADLDCDPGAAGQDAVTTWEQAGGVTPEPFVFAIPAECQVPNRAGFHVEDFRACGVSATYGEERLTLLEFDARFTPMTDGSARWDLEAVVVPPGPIVPAELLGALGGAVLELSFGGASAGAPPLGAETVSGVDPSPF